jgi:pyruvate/2-oxoglutarate dehydrogenase complex dihydrolipoamide acyltransferase (E2) component
MRIDPNRMAALLDGSLTGADREGALAEVAWASSLMPWPVIREREQEQVAMTDDEEGQEKPKRPIPEALRKRMARADEVRPHVTRWVEARGTPAVAARAKLKRDSVYRFVYQGVTPQPGAMDAYEEMLVDPEWAGISGEIKSEGESE